MINENGLKQFISSCTTDNGALIDHLFTNLIEEDAQVGTHHKVPGWAGGISQFFFKYFGCPSKIVDRNFRSHQSSRIYFKTHPFFPAAIATDKEQFL